MSRYLALLCIVSACSTVPLRSMIELSRFDPMTADPSGIAVAVDVSAGLSAKPGETIMTLAANGPNNQSLAEEFVLRENSRLRAATQRHTFIIAPEDINRLEETRATIATWKALDPGTTGSLSVNAKPCRSSTLDPDAPLFIEILFRRAADRPFVVMVPKKDLSKDAPTGLELPICGA